MFYRGCTGVARRASERMRIRYDNGRTVTTLGSLVRLQLKIRCGEEPSCARRHMQYRPPADRWKWTAIRDSVEHRRRSRRLSVRFRRSPDTFLKQIEADFLQSALPA